MEMVENLRQNFSWRKSMHCVCRERKSCSMKKERTEPKIEVERAASFKSNRKSCRLCVKNIRRPQRYVRNLYKNKRKFRNWFLLKNFYRIVGKVREELFIGLLLANMRFWSLYLSHIEFNQFSRSKLRWINWKIDENNIVRRWKCQNIKNS